MDNTIQNDVAFKSRIIVLSPKGFSKMFAGYKYKKFANICHFEIADNEKAWDSSYKTNLIRVFTKGVRTCTAGICVEKGKKASLVWHIENTIKNIEKFPIVSKFIKGTNAIIIGSKKGYENSTELFDKFEQETKYKNIPTTIIKGTKSYEASFFYDSKPDTLYVCLNHIYKNDEYVRSMEDLKQACDVVKISPFDSVEFEECLTEEKQKQKIKSFWSRIFNIKI